MALWVVELEFGVTEALLLGLLLELLEFLLQL